MAEEKETAPVVEEPQVQTPEAVEEQTPEQQPDWMQQAIQDPRVRGAIEGMMFGGGQPSPPAEPQLSPAQIAEQEYTQLRQNPPVFDENNRDVNAATAMFEYQQKLIEAGNKLSDARMAEVQAAQQALNAQSYKQQFYNQAAQADPDFKDYQSQVDQFIQDNNINPALLQQPVILDMIRKAIGYDYLKQKGPRAQTPPPPIDQSYNSGPAPAPKPQATRQATEMDHQLAAFYRVPVDTLLSDQVGDTGSSEFFVPNAIKYTPIEEIRRRR